MEHSVCLLCDSPVSSHSFSFIDQEGRPFCCVGCQTVFQILSARQETNHFRDTDLFQQALASGLISNPALLDQIQKKREIIPHQERIRVHIEINDLWCPSCVEVIRLILLQKRGILHCVVDYATDIAVVEYAPRYISKEEIYSAIAQLGYHPKPLEDGFQRKVSFSLWLRFIVAVFFSMNIMMFSYPIYASYLTMDEFQTGRLFVWLSFFSSLPVLFYSGWPIFLRFWKGLFVGWIGMEALIVLAVLAAFFLSLFEMIQGTLEVYFDSMTVIITFVLLGKIIETKAKFSTKDFLVRLTRALPRRGRKRCDDGKEIFISVKELTLGDQVVVLTGERIVLDGVVVEGEGACDESVMTGEATPVLKQKGTLVIGGTILVSGHLVYRVSVKEKEGTLHHILDIVSREVGRKSVYIRPVDSIVSYFVPIVIVLSLGTAFAILWQGGSFDAAFVRAASILLISCPCAIGIAAPFAESQLLSALAHQGAIVRNRGALLYLGDETVFVCDKTGTVTQGSYRVLKGLENLNEKERRILKGLTVKSNHPISFAIASTIQEEPVVLESVEEKAGRGVEGKYEGKIYRVGSSSWLREEGVEVCKEAVSGVSQVFFAEDKRVACISLGDMMKEGVKEVVYALAPARSWLLSGDEESVVEEVATLAGFDRWQGGCMPLQKRKKIEELKQEGHIVGMLGDGINDAPALMAAHVGISVVNATDISIQVSDILLTTERLEVIPIIRALGRRGRRIVRQNLFWAFFYNGIGIGLALFGYLTPLFAAIAMVLSSLIVLFNARRIAPDQEPLPLA